MSFQNPYAEEHPEKKRRLIFTGIVYRKPVTSVMWRNAHALDFNNEHTTLLNITVNCYT